MNSVLLKKLFIALLVIITIILGVQIINYFFDKSVNLGTPNALLPYFKLDSISKFEFSLQDKDFEFEKSNNVWNVNGFPASQRDVDITLAKLLSINIDYTVSSDSNSYSIYEVNNPNSKLYISSNDQELTIFIGKNTSGNGSFIRYNNTTTTYTTDTDILSILDKDINYFRDKTITTLNPSSINQFNINNNVYKIDNLNWIKNDSAITGNQINQFLVFIANIQATDIANSEDKNLISAIVPELNLKIIYNTQTVTVAFIKYKDNVYYKTNNSEDYFLGDLTTLTKIQQFDNLF